MKDSELPDYCGILEAGIDDLKEDYKYLFDSAISFVGVGTRINKDSKIQFDVCYRNLGNFYRIVVNTSHMDLSHIAFQERLIYTEKRNFALDIKDSLAELLVDLEDLQHPEEESPFYEHL